MKIFKVINVYFENGKLKREISQLEHLLKATEKVLVDRVNDYRELLGERELQRQKIENLELSLYKANKTLHRIVKVAEQNDYENIEMKIKKIIELAKFEDNTSSINK